MKLMTIGQLSVAAGIPASTIRYYESIQLLPEPQRKSGQRRYDSSVLPHLEFIQLARTFGFSLQDIRQLLGHHETTFSQRWQALATRRLLEIRKLLMHATTIQATLLGGLNCACDTVSDCVQCLTQINQVTEPWSAH